MESAPVSELGSNGAFAERSQEYLSSDGTTSASSQNDFVYQCKNCVERHFALTDCILEHALSSERISVPSEEHGHHNPVFTLLEACENEEKKKSRDSITSDITKSNDHTRSFSNTSNLSHNIYTAHTNTILHQDLIPSEKNCSSLFNGDYIRTDIGSKNCVTCGIMNDQTKLRGCKINIQRDALDIQDLHNKYEKSSHEPSFCERVINYFGEKCTCNLFCMWTTLISLFPVVNWLPKYNLKEYFLSDVIAGFTIAILHIPQGMAYGLLASVGAINGLYVSFFPVLIYFLFGTSRHVSIGTFAVVSLMVRNAAEKLIQDVNGPISEVNVTNSDNIVFSNENFTILSNKETLSNSEKSMEQLTNLEAVITIALAVGLWQLFMGIFRLGVISVVLSDHLVSGFSTGAAVHVATSQLKDLFGIPSVNSNNIPKLIHTYISIFSNLKYTNVSAVVISAVAIFTLAVTKEQIDPRIKLKMPIPIDLIVVIVATAVSYLGDFNAKFGTAIMGKIPLGFPTPSPPRFDLLHKVIPDSFAIAAVIFAVSLSMAKLFSKKHNYPINSNQELIALGAANCFSSFFACFPCSASLSRSLVQEKSGGKTQVAGLVSCSFLLIVLLVIAPLFFSLPKCILSSIILVALKGMFMQFKDFILAWKVSKVDALIWIVTFISVVIFYVDIGLLMGVLFSILTVVIRSLMPKRIFLGHIPNTELYVDIKNYNQAQELKGIKIFHFESSLYFANRDIFKDELMKFSTKTVSEKMKSSECKITYNSEIVQYIIIDATSFSYIDMSAIETILEVTNEMKECGISVFLAGCSESVYEILERSGYFDKVKQPSMFPTVHDAVQYCQYLNHNSRL